MRLNQLYLSTIDEKAHFLAKENGLGVEIAEFGTAWNLDDKFEETDAIVRPKLECSDRFILHGPYSELFPCAIDPKIRKLAEFRYDQTIALCRTYGIRKIVLHGGYNPWLYFPCWYTEQSIIFWKEYVNKIPDDMEICLENVLEEEPNMLAEIIRAVDSPKIRMCLDVGHAHAYAKQSELNWLDSCADIINHFHVHNNDGSWDTHSALDCGTIPMEALLENIKLSCPEATITLELTDAEPSVNWLKDNKFLEV